MLLTTNNTEVTSSSYNSYQQFRGIGMKINIRIVIAGLIVLAMVWVGNLYYYNKHVLGEPVFMKHYYDVVKGMNSFQLYYIDNLNSNTSVVKLIFPELGPELVCITDNLLNKDGRYYRMNTIYVTLYNGSMDNIPEQYINKLITKAIVYLSDGRVFNVNLGKIYIYNEEIGQKVLHFVNEMASSDGSGSTGFYADKDISINGIYCKFPEIAEGVMNIKLNDIDLKDVKFPVEVKKNYNFEVRYSFIFKKDDERRNYEYNFPLYIKTHNTTVNKDYDLCFTNHYVQSLNDLDFKKLKEEQGR
jgi:hypothetical protein